MSEAVCNDAFQMLCPSIMMGTGARCVQLLTETLDCKRWVHSAVFPVFPRHT